MNCVWHPNCMVPPINYGPSYLSFLPTSNKVSTFVCFFLAMADGKPGIGQAVYKSAIKTSWKEVGIRLMLVMSDHMHEAG